MMNSEKSNTEERDKEKISDEVTMLARKKSNDGDDNFNNDVVQGRSKVGSEEKDQTKINKIYALASDILDHGEESEKTIRKWLTKKQQLQKMMMMI